MTDGKCVRFTAVVPPDVEQVEAVARRFRDVFGPLDSQLAFPGELLLREALLNAVVHGCQTAEATGVQCAARLKAGNLLIVVCDEGEGFDWRSALRRVAAVNQTHGRGLEIYKAYASRVRFNLRGNRVSLFRHGAEEWKGEQQQ